MRSPSQGSGAGTDPQPKACVKARVGQDIHVAPEEIFEVLLEPDEAEERAVTAPTWPFAEPAWPKCACF